MGMLPPMHFMVFTTSGLAASHFLKMLEWLELPTIPPSFFKIKNPFDTPNFVCFNCPTHAFSCFWCNYLNFPMLFAPKNKTLFNYPSRLGVCDMIYRDWTSQERITFIIWCLYFMTLGSLARLCYLRRETVYNYVATNFVSPLHERMVKEVGPLPEIELKRDKKTVALAFVVAAGIVTLYHSRGIFFKCFDAIAREYRKFRRPDFSQKYPKIYAEVRRWAGSESGNVTKGKLDMLNFETVVVDGETYYIQAPIWVKISERVDLEKTYRIMTYVINRLFPNWEENMPRVDVGIMDKLILSVWEEIDYVRKMDLLGNIEKILSNRFNFAFFSKEIIKAAFKKGVIFKEYVSIEALN